MRDIIIFGAGDISELAFFYFTHDSPCRVAAFTVDAQYIKEPTFCGLPVVDFQQLPAHFPPEKYAAFVAVSYAGLNQVRTEKCEALAKAGYDLVSYVSSKATTFSDLSIGKNCFILEDNTIQPFVKIGNNVTLWSGNHIGHHSRIKDNVFIASHVVISGGVTVGENSFLGVNCTIRDHVTIGKKCVIGAGAWIASDTEDEGVYVTTATPKAAIPSSRLRRI